jgi:hypothetical protein
VDPNRGDEAVADLGGRVPGRLRVLGVVIGSLDGASPLGDRGRTGQ